MSLAAATRLVLYVEDETLIQELIQGALEDAGFEVILAGDGRQAIEVLDDRGASVSALVTDVNLPPGADGWAVARRAREVVPNIPVVYVTGDSAHEWTVHGVPGSVILTKPFAPAQVVVAVATLINQANEP